MNYCRSDADVSTPAGAAVAGARACVTALTLAQIARLRAEVAKLLGRPG